MRSSRVRPSGMPIGLALKCVACSAGVALVASRLDPALAADGVWVGPGSEWTTGTNWSSSPVVPDGTATFTNNGAPTALTISSSTSIDTMEFTAAAPAYSFMVTNGASFAINGTVNSSSPSLPNFAVNAGATLTVGDTAAVWLGSLTDGPAGGGAVVIGPTSPAAFLSLTPATSTTFSGSFSGAGSFELADTATTLTLTGASNGGNIGTIGGDLTLCNCFGGGLTIDGGRLTVNGLGQGVFVDGGTLSVVNGGTLQDNLDLLVSSAMVISGPGSSVTVAGFTGVGIFGPGTLSIGNGGTLNSQSGAEIDAFFGTPSVTVTGAGSTWTVGGGGLAVGGGSTGGPGNLTVSNGGRVSTAGIVGVGDQGPGTSFMTVTGAGSTVTAGGSLLIGQTAVAIGTVTIADGGVVNAAGLTSIGAGSTLYLGSGGLSGAIVTPTIESDGAIIANFTDTLTVAANIAGTGTLSKAGPGTLALTGTNTFSGGTTVTGGTLLVNGSLAGAVTVNSSATLGGTGSVGTVVGNGGTFAPGNSIGTLNVVGNFTQNGGTYQVEVNGAGQSDRITVGGIATLNGGTVQVLAAPGTRTATYTILSATGGVSGAYSGTTSNLAFVRPSLSYDASNVYLTMTQSFVFGAQTPNQYAVASALDQASAGATGDFANVLGALNALTLQQAPAALNALSGQQYADFGTMNVQGAALFMNVVGQQMALARSGAGGGQRQALAQACDVEACEALGPWSAWASALGGLGAVAGNGSSSTLTYNFGGAAAGIDYRLDPRFLIGLGAGYAAGNQWVDGFLGRGWTDTVSVMAYGSFANAGFYADALAGYAWSGNQMQRQIQIPGLQRTANGSTGANQFLGQIETGYRIGIFAPAGASITPFARLQASTVTQNAFSEWGANSLSLNVAQQTTNSLRTVLGADLAGAVGLGGDRNLALALRLGWLHEYADTGRPITAAFTGAPAGAFTVYGATPQRDAAVIGFSAGTSVAEATQLYLRYDGEIGTGASNHMLNLGLRITW